MMQNKTSFQNDPDFQHLTKVLINEDNGTKRLLPIFLRVVSCIAQSNPADVIKHEYMVDGHRWVVYHGPTFKMTVDTTDWHYNCFFSKLDGFNLRFGKTLDEDPICCELGPEILDLEVCVNGCVPVKGSINCRYCYKNNTNAAPVNMTFEKFEDIVKRFPINLSQIAFGITGLQTNPDLPKMFEQCRQLGIIPNLTTVGADLNDKMKDMVCRLAGACAVSCYTGAKELCYKTIKSLHDYAQEKYGRDLHVNMHLLVSKDNMEHVREVLRDISEKKVPGLKSVVFLRIKPKGRAAKMDCIVPMDIYREIVSFSMEHGISFGFDSCSATPVIEVLKEKGHPELCSCCEPCESSKLSSYINVYGEYWSCSFAEGLRDFINPIDVCSYETVTEWWNSDEVKNIRFCSSPKHKSCPIFDLDGAA